MSTKMIRNGRESQRGQRGNMLLFTLAMLLFVGLMCTLFLSFGWLFVAQERLQNTGNEVALFGSTWLNAQDRVGQMNNMVARSRQLIYTAKEVETEIHTIDPDLEPLSQYLVDQAKEGAQMLDKERETANQKIRDEAQKAITDHFNKVKNAHFMDNVFIGSSVPEIESIDFGYIDKIESNVESMKGVDELASFDKGNQTWESKGILHKANHDAKLPNFPQHFYVSSLAAPVDGVVAPARVTSGQVFRKLDPSSPYLPSAVCLKMKANVKATFAGGTESLLHVTAAAATTGAEELN